MNPKKNPRFDLNRKSLLFFQIGLVLVLFISWRGIEMKTNADDPFQPKTLLYQNLLKEITPLKVKREKEKPKKKIKKHIQPKPTAKDTFVVIKEKKELLDSLFRGKKTLPVDTTLFGKDWKYANKTEEPAKIPFSAIQRPPVFPGCEKEETNEARKFCFMENIRAYILDNFDRGLASELGLSGIAKTKVLFTIDENGNVIDVRARGVHPKLEEEAIRVIESLPKMLPGLQRGNPVQVMFYIPIAFEVR